MDPESLLSRRRALTLLTGAGVAVIVGCSSDDKTAASKSSASSSTMSSSSSANPTATASSVTATKVVAEETEGPFPGDGSNGPNVLTEDGVVRRDITKSFGSMSGTAAGVPTTLELTVVDAGNGGAPLKGAAVYIWHCDRDGNYSLYSSAAQDQNYLRGVQETDANGKVTFQTIFPARYPGRWPHVHYEVYPSVDAITSASKKIATSQLAIPKDICDAVYATSGYETSVRSLSQLSLSSDMVFRDGVDTETPTVTGDPSTGITLAMTSPVNA